MRKFDLKARVKAIRKDQLEDDELLETRCRIENDLMRGKEIKTLPMARLHEMAKVKEELKAMLPKLTPSEVRRWLYIRDRKTHTSFLSVAFYDIIA